MSEEIPLSETESFRPRYDCLSKDLERLMEHVTNLYHDDRLGRTVAGMHESRERAAAAIEDAYFDKGLFAGIERRYREVSLDDGGAHLPRTIERLIAAGQGQRVVRICRTSLAQGKADFWFWIDERNRGFEPSEFWAASEKVQRNSHRKNMARIPEVKARLLAQMDVAQGLMQRAGATGAQLARLAAERGEIEAEQRRRPEGKPDPRKMDADVFWEVIGTAGDGGALDRIGAVTDQLARFKATPIKAFDKHLRSLDARAYRGDIWALAYLLRGGASDDDFEAFRCWLILQGREVFEAALANPDGFDVARFDGGSAGCEALRDAAALAYEMRTGKPMPRAAFRPLRLGEPDLEEEAFARALPRVAAAVAS